MSNSLSHALWQADELSQYIGPSDTVRVNSVDWVAEPDDEEQGNDGDDTPLDNFLTCFEQEYLSDSDHVSLVLPSSVVIEDEDIRLERDLGEERFYSRYHASSGWTIRANVCADHYLWVEQFSASHADYGWVRGDFATAVYASCRASLDHFVFNHPPFAFDSQDI